MSPRDAGHTDAGHTGAAYTGDVRPDGPADVRVLDDLVVRKLCVGPMANNAYLLTCRASGEQLLVDAAAEPDRLLDLVRTGSPQGSLAVVLTTHRHADHVGALADVVGSTGAALAVGADDAAAVTSSTTVPATRLLADGDGVRIGQVALEVIGLRGHTPGSVALAYNEPAGPAGRVHLFTGDSLFPGGPGRTSSAGDFTSLMDDLETRVFGRFDDRTWVYPGHGADTTLGAERPALGSWRERGW